MKGKKPKHSYVIFATYLKIMYRKSGDFLGILFLIRFLARFFFKKPLNLQQKTTKFSHPKQKGCWDSQV
jgi:hypothetical protein